eukprot:GHVU01222843.1.p1 GENE.GHVU01222843.1~~GHVU01222843.1.p1  ORF type:complete len:334 (+),score=59.99 GHVU01222843.1:1391-2392(+)
MEDACKKVVESSTWTEWFKTQKPSGKKAGLAFRRRVLRENFWIGLRLVTKAMEPLVRLLRSVDGTKAGISGKYMVRLSAAEGEVEDAMRHFSIPVRNEVMSIIRERRKQSHNRLYGVAFCLEPAYVGQDPVDLLGSDWAEQAQQDWMDYVASLPDEQQRPMTEAKTQFDLAEGKFAHSVAVDARDVAAPHIWWYNYGKHTPVLQRAASRILSTPISASACERNWSLFSFVLSRRRLRMGANKARKVVAAMANNIAIKNVRNPIKLHDRVPWLPPDDDDEQANLGGLSATAGGVLVCDGDSVGDEGDDPRSDSEVDEELEGEDVEDLVTGEAPL